MAFGTRYFDPLRRDKRLLPLIVMIGCIMAGSGIIAPILSLYAQTLGVSSTLVGMLVTIFGVGRLVANLPAGYLSQRIGRRPLLAAGPLIVAVSAAGAALTTNFSTLLAWRFLQGIGSGIYMTTSMAALADISPPASRAGNLALYQAAVQLGATMGPAIGGYLANFFGYTAPFWAYMLVGLTAAALAILAFEDTLNKVEARKPLPSSVSKRGMMTAPFTAVCILAGVVFFTRAATLFQLIPLLGSESFGLSVGDVGLALTVNALMNFVALPFASPMIDRFGSRATVFLSTLGGAGSLALIYAAPSVVWFWVAVILLGFCSGVSYPSTSSFTIGCLPRERYGPGMGMQRTFGDVGFVVGPVILGALGDASGGHFAGTMLNVGLLVAAAVIFMVGSRGMRPELR
jgi:DHA1 family multidrug resistance protein-like MFS transporter